VPLYEYKCKKCKHRFEKIRKFSDRPLRKCPECGGPVEQLVSRSAVQFKGSGFYATDYPRTGSSRSSESGTSSEAAKDGAGSSTKPAAEKTDKSDKTDSKKTEKKPSKK
jgi:putative FmdB family regulatory protein